MTVSVRESCSIFEYSSVLTVISSSLTDWSSSLEVSISSFADCISSFVDWSSSFVDFSSSFEACSSSMVAWRLSRVYLSSSCSSSASRSSCPFLAASSRHPFSRPGVRLQR